MKDSSLTKITDIAWQLVNMALKKGDCAVDATMGNGNDTLFLRKIVGDEGKVYAFDIQEMAIDNTKEKLGHLCENVELIKDSHINIKKYVKEEINAAVYNLGFLPKGDKSIITQGNTTIMALKETLELLKKKGIIIISIYYGHEGGSMEKEMVLDFVKNLDRKSFHVVKMDFFNQINNPPILIGIEKK